MARRPPWVKRAVREEKVNRKADAVERRKEALESQLADQNLVKEVGLKRLASDLRQIEAVYGSLSRKERESRLVESRRLPRISIGAGIGSYEKNQNEVLRALVMLRASIASSGKEVTSSELARKSGRPMIDVTDVLERCLEKNRSNEVRFKLRSQLETRLGTRLPISIEDVESFMESLSMKDRAAYITMLRKVVEGELAR